MIQQIQEETATNIYFPTPLVGVLNSPQPGSQQGVGYRHVQINMTGVGMQPTGPMAMPMTGAMSHSHGAPCPSMDMNAAGGGPLGLPRMNGNYHHQHNAHGRHAPLSIIPINMFNTRINRNPSILTPQPPVECRIMALGCTTRCTKVIFRCLSIIPDSRVFLGAESDPPCRLMPLLLIQE